MPIKFRHDAAGIPLGKDKAKYNAGMNMVAQQQKTDAETRQRAETQKYETMQQANMQDFQWQRDRAQDVNRAGMFNAELQHRDKQAEEARKFQQAEAEARRNQAMMDRAQQQEHGFIMQAIENGEYDQTTARALQQNILDESRAMTNPRLDATQRQAALDQVMADRAKFTALRRDPPPKPAPQPVTYVDDSGREWLQSGKDKWEQIKPAAEQQQGPIDSSVGLQDTKNKDRYLDQAEKMLVDPEDPTKKPSRDQVWAKARELWDTDEYQRTRGSIPRNDGPMGPPSPASPSNAQGGQPASPSGGVVLPPYLPQEPSATAPVGEVAMPPSQQQQPPAAAPAPSPSPSGGVVQPPSGSLPVPQPVAAGGQGQPVGGQGSYKPTWGEIDPGFVKEPAIAGQAPQPGAMVNEPAIAGQGLKPGAMSRVNEPAPAVGSPGAVNSQAPTYSPENIKKFFDTMIGNAKTPDQKNEFSGVMNFLNKGQPTDVANAIMTGLNPDSTTEEKQAAVALLRSRGVSYLDIVRKSRPAINVARPKDPTGEYASGPKY
jgi:hypothetical protein